MANAKATTVTDEMVRKERESRNIQAWWGTNYRPIEPIFVPKAPTLECPDPELLYGLELEIEAASAAWAHNLEEYMLVKEDGSLRNGGLEFITYPGNYSNIMALLSAFFKSARMRQEHLPEHYSERTSVHVHTNVRDMTYSQLAALMALYQVFEKCYFYFAGGERDKNIFCVPLSECVLARGAINKLLAFDHGIVHAWQKYAAFNLRPISNIGTVEWRHLPGTNDVTRIGTWLRLIGAIYKIAKTKTYDEVIQMLVHLNTSSQYDFAVEIVFGDDARYFRASPTFIEDVEFGVLNLKYAMMNRDVQVNAWANLLVEPAAAAPEDDEPEPEEDDHDDFARVLPPLEARAVGGLFGAPQNINIQPFGDYVDDVVAQGNGIRINNNTRAQNAWAIVDEVMNDLQRR